MIRRLLAWLRGTPAALEAGQEARTHFIYVYLPESLEPDERHWRYEAPLDAELRLAGVGEVTGGGTLLDEPDEDGERGIVFSGLDVDAIDLDAARAVLREHLPELGCRPGTRLEYQAGGDWEDRFDGQGWAERQPLTDYADRG